MALFMKQDFSPPILSRKWFAIKFRPNVLLHSRAHIVAILESALLFREDSIEVEQEAPSPEEVWWCAGGVRGGWMTRGERLVSLLALSAGLLAAPPRSMERSTLVRVCVLAALPLALRQCHRALSRGTALPVLLARMRDYLALARRAAACLKECTLMCKELDSVTTVLESTHTLLCRQQTELAVLMSRASSALLGNAPWLRADVAWEAVSKGHEDRNLLQIHHAFLIVQSTLLKHIAMAHYIPSAHAQKVYKNHNERLYWLHTVLIEHLNKEFKENYDALDRMYRLLKNFGNKDVNPTKTPGSAINDSWLYSEVHSGVATTCLELKMTLNKCTSLDMFLDSCALNKQELDLDVLNKDLDGLIDGITKCLNTTQSAQMRLKKLQGKFGAEKGGQPINNTDNEVAIEENANILKIEDKEPESKDEVFYYLKTEDDVNTPPASDVTTEPGKKEKEATKVVLNELKRKLVKREDLMRERERQALVKTMPELKDNVPEFPRQIEIDQFENKKGYISKLQKRVPRKRLFKIYKIQYKRRNNNLKKKNFILKSRKYIVDSDIENNKLEAKVDIKGRKVIITITIKSKNFIITRWYKHVQTEKKTDFDSSGMSEGLSDVEAGTVNKTVNHAVNYEAPKNQQNEATNFKFTKKDLELSPSTSESDFENFNERRKQMSLLKDVRRHRVARKKKYPVKRGSISIDKEDVDESLKPMEYSFGTGMAIASVLQVNNTTNIRNMAQEEVFIGDGEVSTDSGNDEDA